MFYKLSAHSNVKRILLVSLSNIGDVVLTFPVFDVLRDTFPTAEISVVVGPKAEKLFSSNQHVHRTIVLDKTMTWVERVRWFLDLRQQHFDLVVDLRNSMLPFLLNARCVTPPAFGAARCHMKDKHLWRLARVLEDALSPAEKYAGALGSHDLDDAARKVGGLKGYVLFAPGAADKRKRWGEEGFAQVIRHVRECYNRPVVLVGDDRDRLAVERILKGMPEGAVNLCGSTTLPELVGVIRRAGMAVTNDSGIMHLASYFDIPTVALFGPTDPFFYGPWSSQSDAIRKGVLMGDIKAEDVIEVLDRKYGKL